MGVRREAECRRTRLRWCLRRPRLGCTWYSLPVKSMLSVSSSNGGSAGADASAVRLGNQQVCERAVAQIFFHVHLTTQPSRNRVTVSCACERVSSRLSIFMRRASLIKERIALSSELYSVP
jgi:hypothetical protein